MAYRWTLCALLGCLVFASGCGQGPGGASDDPGYDVTSPDTVPRTTSGPAPGGENLTGTEGNDDLRGGPGSDVLRGMGGDDELYGGEGRDRLYGGPGDDVIDAQDPDSGGRSGRDEISCGPGRDEVLMDADDGEKPRDCEMAGVGSP